MRLEDLRPTERSVRAPASTLVELVSSTGHLYTGIRIDAALAGHPELGRPMHDKRRYLEAPMVAGVTELDVHNEDEQVFVYPTGMVWTIAEVLQLLRPLRPFGARAGLELCYIGAMMLDQAAVIGERHGVYSHGNLDPWRIALEPDGDVQILGYGIPQLELLDSTHVHAVADSYRYAPPERLRGEAEDVSSDLVSLALVALELITGEPVYDGNVDRAKHAAERASGAHQLHQWRDVLTEDVRHVFQRALGLYRDERYDDPEEFARACQFLLESPIAGTSLAELMAQVSARYTREVPLRHAAEEERPPPEEDLRWASVRRAKAPPEPRRDRIDRRESRTDPKDLARSLERSQARARRASRPPRDTNAMFPRTTVEGELERYLVSVEGEEPRWVKLGKEEPMARSAARLVDRLCPTPIDMSGEMLGWYRLCQDGDAWFGDAATSVLDPAEPVNLEFVENDLVKVTFLVETRDGVTRDDALVGTAVHAQFLLSRLADRHGFRQRSYALYVDDCRLDPFQILDDFEPKDGFEVHARRDRTGRRR